jgi:hypothetical protein
MNGGLSGSRTGSSSSPDSCSNGDLDDDLDSVCCNSPGVNGSLSVAIQPGNVMQHYQPSHTPVSHPPDTDVVLSDTFKTMNMVPYTHPSYPHPAQQQMKKDEVIQPRDVMKVAQPAYEVSLPPQQMQARPNPYQQHQVQYQPAYYDMPRESPNPQQMPPQAQQTMYLQSNQTPFVANGQVYQQQPMQQVYSYQQDYQHYPTMFASQPFPHAYNMRTAIARGMNSETTGDLLKQSTTNELSLNIPSTKETKDDSWKFGNGKSNAFNRVDSCLDSGRGSSIGYSSDTFSPLSSASAGSRGSPQSVQESDTRKIWDDKIWGAPSETSKLSSWSSGRASSGWDFFLDNRLSDHEEQNTSSESVGKCHDHQSSVLDKQNSYSSMKEWPRSGDILSNDTQGLLGLFPSGSPATKRPPPGVGLK